MNPTLNNKLGLTNSFNKLNEIIIPNILKLIDVKIKTIAYNPFKKVGFYQNQYLKGEIC